MAAKHVVGDVVEHLGPVDNSPHSLIRRFPSSVVALVVEGSQNIGGHRLGYPKKVVRSTGDVDPAVEEPLV